ncbi:MAG: hypothetical protein HQK53_06775, partial [Oligoflexia bacterium]|nr:hypothetical protein [Oligoflexia bacterium]
MNIEGKDQNDFNTSVIANGDYHRISPTAKFVAYSRQFSDIPFSKEIALLSNSQNEMRQIIPNDENEQECIHFFSVMTESRYKSTISTIRRYKIKQILEFASGLSFRGPVMAKEVDIYVETDLPGIMDEKFDILSKIPAMRMQVEKGNVFFYAANALSYKEIENTLKHFNPNLPLGIVHEGLLMYLSMQEKEIMAHNCHKLLKKFGGVWITSDLRTREELERRNQLPSKRDAIKKLTGRDMEQNC